MCCACLHLAMVEDEEIPLVAGGTDWEAENFVDEPKSRSDGMAQHCRALQGRLAGHTGMD